MQSLPSNRARAPPERVNVQPENSRTEGCGEGHGGETGARWIQQKRLQVFEPPSEQDQQDSRHELKREEKNKSQHVKARDVPGHGSYDKVSF